MTPKLRFLTNTSYVLLCVAEDPSVRIREIATTVGITERASHKILTRLIDEGYISRERRGRRNHYTVKHDELIGDPLVKEQAVEKLLEVLLPTKAPSMGKGTATA